MTTSAAVADWLDRYVAAWVSGDPDDIGRLFSADAVYRYHPADPPIIGREAIVDSWLDDPDDPGTFEAQYEAYAVDGDRAVATGWSRYFSGPDHATVETTYDNCFVMAFDSAGHCTEFTEWFRRRPEV
ncbi:MAG TPA: nuclear transport factor 2 family protein [Acidimicrobiia bacterium]|nr:nuclear transport factor 2 family protein [Acidimicrobiia bacterium]